MALRLFTDSADVMRDTSTLPMRHLQILNTDRYHKDFQITKTVANLMQVLVANTIVKFLTAINGSSSMADTHIQANNLPLVILYIYQKVVADAKPYPFSRSVRVAEDYYQRIRKLVTNETSPDFNLLTADECGNPFTYITRIGEYQDTFRVGFQVVLDINSWIKNVDDALKDPFTEDNLVQIFATAITLTPSKAPVCAEVNELRFIQFYEDVYVRWRNVVFNCKNLLPSGSDLQPDTMMALYYASMDNAKKSALPCLRKQQSMNRF